MDRVQKSDHLTIEKQSTEDRREVYVDGGEEVQDESTALYMSATKLWLGRLTLGVLWVGSQLPLYFAAGALQYVVADIGGAEMISWAGTAFTLVLGAVTPFTGNLSDVLGRKWVAVLGSALLIIGGVLVPTAQHINQLIAGMGISGAGCGIAEMTAIAGISETVARKNRGYVIGTLILSLLPFSPYVLYSELFSVYSSWRWGLWLAFIWNVIAFAMVLLLYRPPKCAIERSEHSIWHRIDFLGGFLSIVGITLLLLALTWGGTQYRWGSPRVISTLVLATVCLVAFVVWQKFAQYPMIPLGLFAKDCRVLALTFIIIFIAGMAFLSFTNFYPLICANVYDVTGPTSVGLRALGASIANVLSAAIVSTLLSRYPSQLRNLLLFSTVMMTSGMGGLMGVTPNNFGVCIALGVIAGIGIGGITIPTTTIIVIVAPYDLLGTVVALAVAVRNIGGAVGNAIYFNILNERLAKDIPKDIAKYALGAGLPKSSVVAFTTLFAAGEKAQLANVPGVTAEVIAAATLGSQWGYAHATHLVFGVSIAFGAATVLCSLFLGSLKKYTTAGIDIHRGL